MYEARQYLDKKALLNLYYSYIYVHFIYCIVVWGSSSHYEGASLISPTKRKLFE